MTAFRDDRARKHFLTVLTEMFTHVFKDMTELGLLRSDGPEMLAFAYTSPISADSPRR